MAVFLAAAVIEFTGYRGPWLPPAAGIVTVLIIGLGLQTGMDTIQRSRRAPTLALVQGIVGAGVALAGGAAVVLRADSIIDRGIFSGYEEAVLFVLLAVATIAEYALIAIAVRQSASWFTRPD